MELPEEDKQAFIDAARRRMQPQQGGAAFGVYPSSGKRPEKLNVSRDVNMPAQVARGWAAGTLGLPGDIEGLGRMAANFAFGPGGVNVSETPLLPTSEFYQEYLPGGDERPAAKFASGLGALAGGAGSTKVAGAAVKGAQATGRALGPKAAEMAEGYLQRSGLAPSVIKPKGGNWLSGSVEGATQPLKTHQNPAQEVAYIRGELERPQRGEVYQQLVGRLPQAEREDAINNWIDTKLNKYIRNEMATPEDPVRKLAERGVLHFDAPAVEATTSLDEKRRAFAQANDNKWGYGQSQLAQNWEDASDKMVNTLTAGKIAEMNPDMVKRNWSGLDWVYKADPETMIYGLNRGSGSPTDPSIDSLGFSHLIDELRNATRADSDLPANLRWKPEDLKKVTMEQAVERVAKINEYRAAKKAEADELLSRNPATFQFKDYQTVPGTQEPNSKGLSWKQIQPPNLEMPQGIKRVQQSATQGGIDVPGVGFIAAKWDAKTGLDWAGAERDAKKLLGKKPLQEALDYEADVMGHCVRGYCNDVLSGNKQIYSLRDKKGEPHVTIETRPKGVVFSDVAKYIGQEEADRLLDQGVTLTEMIQRIPNFQRPQEIIQIKGKGNAAPKAEYLPFVQDFVRSGNWSRVGDFKNTGFDFPATGPQGIFDLGDIQRLNKAGIDVPKYLTRDEAKRLQDKLYEIDTGKNPETGYAKGGLVEDTDAIAAKLTGMDKDKALTHALRMANAKQEAHMGAGGFLTLAKGAKAAKAAEEAAAAAKAAKVAKPVEKAAEAAKPAVIGPQAKALETARKNAVKMLGLPENNTAMDRAKALGFTTDYLHGTQRMDRLLEKKSLDPRRATSGPMPFGTSTPELASGYAMQKVDTSLRAADEGDVTKYFEVAPKDLGLKGMKAPLPVEKAWHFMSPEQRAEIAKLAPRVGYENLDEFTGKFIVHPEGVNATLSPDQWDWIMKREAKGNPLAALREMWHESGQLFNEPEQLGEIYRLAGVKAPISQSNAPWTEAKGVLLGKARITNPLDTANTEQVASVIEPLKQAFARDRSKTSHGPDQWAKQSRYTPKEWVEELERDLAQGKDSYVWTSIPDKVTEELKRLNFNGIIDRSGKGGGAKEPVIIPFEPEQVRSRFAAFDPARINEKDLLGAADPSLLAGTAVASGIGLGALGQMSKPKPEEEEKKKAAGGLAKRM